MKCDVKTAAAGQLNTFNSRARIEWWNSWDKTCGQDSCDIKAMARQLCQDSYDRTAWKVEKNVKSDPGAYPNCLDPQHCPDEPVKWILKILAHIWILGEKYLKMRRLPFPLHGLLKFHHKNLLKNYFLKTGSHEDKLTVHALLYF